MSIQRFVTHFDGGRRKEGRSSFVWEKKGKKVKEDELWNLFEKMREAFWSSFNGGSSIVEEGFGEEEGNLRLGFEGESVCVCVFESR